MDQPKIVSLPNSTVKLGIGWDFFDKKVDLDVACFVYDAIGNLVDIVFFKNLQSNNGAIVHSGDSLDGEKSGDDEQITLNLPQISPEVSIMIFPITVQTPDQNFSAVETAYFRAFSDPNTDIFRYDLGLSDHNSIVMCIVHRDPSNASQWLLRTVATHSHKKGLDQLVSELDTTLSLVVPKDLLAERTINVANKMDLNKGDEFSVDLQNVIMGLGWDAGCDLDAWCYMYSGDWFLVDEVGYSHLKSNCGSIVHSGDNLTGAGSGDDERISVDLSKVPEKVKYLFFAVKIFTSGMTFENVKNPFVRMLDKGEKVISHYKIKTVAGQSTALVFCKIYRLGNGWRFSAIGEGVSKEYVSNPKTLTKFLGRPQNVTLTVDKGRNLAAKDSSGTSDPYLVVNFLGQEVKSQIIKKTLNPEWKFQTVGVVWGGSVTVKIAVWDWDRFSSDDFMGQIVEDMPIGTEKWFVLKGRGKKEEISGDILVSLKAYGI